MVAKKRKVAFCIFAHPDDEAFGPSGTIAKLAQEYDVYVLCATRGEAGHNHRPEDNRHIAEIREEELHESGKVLGVKNVLFLDFLDGTLSNNMYHKLAEKIKQHADYHEPELFLTWEPMGVSGHIDHITVSMVTTYLFNRLPYVKKLMYYCLLDTLAAERKDYFIYFPPGYKREQIDEVVDTSKVFDKKVEAIHTHKSQAKDAKRILELIKNLPKEEYFLVRTK